MDKITKNIINKTIEKEYYRVSDEFGKLSKKNKEWGMEDDKYSCDMEEIAEKLKEVLPEEHKNLVEDLINASLGILTAEAKIFFKEGVVLGATELNYLGEVGVMLNFI